MKSLEQYQTNRTLVIAISLSCLMFVAGPSPVQAQFFDDFNGQSLSTNYQPTLPPGPLGSGGVNLTYLGAPNYSFSTVDGASVLRLTNSLNDRQRVGWNTSTPFDLPDFRLEVRFNSLVQSPTTSIDSFIEAWLIDPNNPSNFLFAGPSGQNYGLTHQFRGGDSFDNQYQIQSASYTDNNWYRLVITGSTTQDIRASLFADDGTTELVGQTFAFNTSAFPNGFELGLSQATGVPGGSYPVDVAIDYISLTSTAVPEPSSCYLLLLGGSLMGAFVIGRSRFSCDSHFLCHT